jgi:hypothetical protein
MTGPIPTADTVPVDVLGRVSEDFARLEPGEPFDPNYDRWRDAKAVNDDMGIEQMVAQGQAIRTKSCSVLILDWPVSGRVLERIRFKVRILDGPAKGKVCWVPDTYLGWPDPPKPKKP